jgi:hypothetical protein
MRIKMIISPDGKTYFNVAQGEIGGNIRILAGSSGYGNLSDKPDLSVFSTRSELSVLSDRITANVTQTTSVGNRVTLIESAEYITTAQGHSWYASKTMEDGSTIISKINQTPTAVTIDASHINLVGKVTFNMLDSSAQSTINGKANTSGLGSLAYQSAVSRAMLDSTVITGGKIVTSLIDADAIFANYAYLGHFTLTNGWLTCNASPGTDVGYIDMRSSKTRIAFGRDLTQDSPYGYISTTAIIENNNSGSYYNVCLSLKATGNEPVALKADGAVMIKGDTSFVEGCITDRQSIISVISGCRNFVYQPTSPLNVYLPTKGEIASLFGYFGDGNGVDWAGFIRIHVLVTRWATSYIRVRESSSSTPLVDENGNVLSYREMSKGDYCEFTYYNGAWYMTSIHT